MIGTDKVFGQLAAMHALVENFPMSILDMFRGKHYTSIFEFIIDVLSACGVPVNEIIDKILNKIYGIEFGIKDGIDNAFNKIQEIDNEELMQNEFLNGLEESIKVILEGLLSGLFSCSAIPILPNKVFDGPNSSTFAKLRDKNPSLFYALESDTLQNTNPFVIPINAIDPMGILRISPTGHDGRLYYAINGKDIYYKKEWVETSVIKTKEIIVEQETTTTITNFKDVNRYEYNIPIFISQVNNGSFFEESYVFELGEEYVNTTSDIEVTVLYSPSTSNAIIEWKSIIKWGTKTTENELIISPEDVYIHNILINGVEGGCECGDKAWVYLDRDSSLSIIEELGDNLSEKVIWGEQNTETYRKEVKEEVTITANVPQIEEFEEFVKVLQYKECKYEDLNGNEPERVDFVKDTDVLIEDPEYIVCYVGENPNTLYRSKDMNAFIWYCLRKGVAKGTGAPQIELNHQMWDSRVFASKNHIERGEEEWNNWYNSKSTYTDEFKYNNQTITDTTPIYPIIHLEPQGGSGAFLTVHLPSQRYLYPKFRKASLEGNTEKVHGFNATIIKFNHDYLKNIQILQPKLLLTGLLESLLGLTLSELSSITLTKKMIKEKLSSAIVRIVEANDMEVENCYMEFSNEEFNSMLEDMVLSRYDATYYGSPTQSAKVYDVKKYANMIDNISSNAIQNGTITEIKKMVTEVAVTPGVGGSVDFSMGGGENILTKLLWAIVMPIIMSIFTPQVLLLFFINLELMGLIRIDEFLGYDFTKILNFIFNKIFTIVKSIIIFIKDKIIEFLINILFEVIMPLILKTQLVLLLEKINDWLTILKAAIACLPTFSFSLNKRFKIYGSVNEVSYADIVNDQNTPEATSTC